MDLAAAASAPSELQFAALVDALAADPRRHSELTDLLHESHPVYDQRGTTTTVRMRAWVLVALSRVGLSTGGLLFVLGELDTGTSAYLVAAAARALRSHPTPTTGFAPFVMRALANIRYHDEPVSFEKYGDYAVSSGGTSAVRELLETLAWLGPHAREVLPELESLRRKGAGLSRRMLTEVDRTVAAVRDADRANGATCCALPGDLGDSQWWPLSSRRGCAPIEDTVFEDQEGAATTFREFFVGHPSIVVFFYTRCDNPLKCSLTVTKLGRVQQLLEAAGLTAQIRTAAITYDPGFDLPERLCRYGRNRGVRMDDGHRLLRATEGIDALRRHFGLRVNFIESLVNWHRIEAYILDADGRIAASFERLHWDEQQLVDRAIEVLKEKGERPTSEAAPGQVPALPYRKPAIPLLATLASLGVAFFPKCPLCWAAYLSMFGIAGLGHISYSSWLQPVLGAVMAINVATAWLQARSTGRMLGFFLVCAGAAAIVVSKLEIGGESVATWGVALTFAGSLLTALRAKHPVLSARA